MDSRNRQESRPDPLRSLRSIPGADISPERFFARVIVGGTASKLSGGSFSNGGFTAAFAYLFNEVGNCYQRGHCSAKIMAAPTDSGDVRGTDAAGCGGYDCRRDGGRRVHHSIDFSADEGDTVKSPIDGKITRVFYPGKPGLKAVEIVGSSLTVRVLYLEPDVSLVGRFVKVGDAIGTAQEMRKAYGVPNMINHVHVDMTDRGQRVNPLGYIGKIRKEAQ